jgi:hypothetical protein
MPRASRFYYSSWITVGLDGIKNAINALSFVHVLLGGISPDDGQCKGCHYEDILIVQGVQLDKPRKVS